MSDSSAGSDPFGWTVLPPPDGAAVTDIGSEIVPWCLRDLLLRLQRDYGSPPVYITENGAAYHEQPGTDGVVHDQRRIDFLRGHLGAVADAIADGANVRGYFHWSLMDNWEWALGYRPRFGLVHVDYPTGRRTIKDSGRFYASVIASGKMPG